MEEKGKKLGMLHISMLSIGAAIGTGIFMMLGPSIAHTGRSIVLVCAIDCVLMLLSVWYTLAFSSMFVLPGGTYDMRAMALPPVLSGVSAWFQVAGVFVLAGHSITITEFAAILWPQINEFKSLFAIIVLTVTYLCTIRGSRVLTIIQNLTVYALIGALALFLFFGIPQVDPATFFSNSDGDFWAGGTSGFIAGMSTLCFACSGTSAQAAMGPVTNRPKRNIPLASVVAVIVVAIVYCLMAYVASGVLPFEQIAGQNISATAQVIMPRWGFLVFTVGGGIFAVASTMLAVVAGSKYPIMRVAEDGWIPSAFLKTTKSGYPWVTYLVMYVVGIIPLVSGLDIESIVSNVMIPTMILNVFLNFYCVRLPKLYPEQWKKRGVRFPLPLWNIFSTVGGIVSIFIVCILFTNLNTRGVILCIGELLVLFALTFVSLKKKWVTPERLNTSKQAILEKSLSSDID